MKFCQGGVLSDGVLSGGGGLSDGVLSGWVFVLNSIKYGRRIHKEWSATLLLTLADLFETDLECPALCTKYGPIQWSRSLSSTNVSGIWFQIIN